MSNVLSSFSNVLSWLKSKLSINLTPSEIVVDAAFVITILVAAVFYMVFVPLWGQIITVLLAIGSFWVEKRGANMLMKEIGGGDNATAKDSDQTL